MTQRYQKKHEIVQINSVINSLLNKMGKSMNKPVQNFRDKGLDVAVWPAKNGGYSFTFRKTYKNKETQQYVETKYLYKEEVEKLIELLKEAVKYASNRSEHTFEHKIAGGASTTTVAAKHEEIDIDDLPF